MKKWQEYTWVNTPATTYESKYNSQVIPKRYLRFVDTF